MTKKLYFSFVALSVTGGFFFATPSSAMKAVNSSPSFHKKDFLDPRIVQEFQSDWSLARIGKSSFMIHVKPEALEGIIHQAQENWKHEFQSDNIPGNVEVIMDFIKDKTKNIPEAEGTIYITFSPPSSQYLNNQDLEELKEAFEASPLKLEMTSPSLWKVKAHFSSLPDKDTIKNVVQQIDLTLQEKHIFPDSVSKNSIEKAWNFAKASLKDVEIILHIK